jgi:hypothetical protein
MFDALANDRSNHRIEAGAIATAGEHADPHRPQISRDEPPTKR